MPQRPPAPGRKKPKGLTPVSVRAQQKLDKRERLRDAAFELFTRKGYEATTTAQVADRAGVAKGTLFLYARDKADLLFLVMYDRLQTALDGRFATLPKGPLVTQLLHLFRGVFQMYSEHPELARAFVRVLPGAQGPQAQRVSASTFTFLMQVAGLVERAKARGEVSADADTQVAAQSFFALYFMGLMLWLSGMFALDDVLERHLAPAFTQYVRGLRP